MQSKKRTQTADCKRSKNAFKSMPTEYGQKKKIKEAERKFSFSFASPTKKSYDEKYEEKKSFHPVDEKVYLC